jgi:predicted ABC-type exoprotein transport system permease subunit
MKKNMGSADRLIRLLIAAALIMAWISHWVTGTLGIAAMVIAVVFVLTSLISVCPLYSIFGIDTCKVKKRA